MIQKYFPLSASLLPTEPVGSIPRPEELIAKLEQFNKGNLSSAELALAEAAAIDDTIAQFEKTGSPVIIDGEQSIYPLRGLDNLTTSDRRLPQLTKAPFRYGQYAVEYLKAALTKTSLPVKQPVISASALSMIYPPDGIPGYTRDEFLCDLVNEVERDIRQCLEACADSVQIDFTDARLAIQLDPSMKLLEEFIQINNRVLDRFSFEDRQKIGIHACPVPAVFRLHAGRFYFQLSSEKDRPGVLSSLRASMKPHQFVFVGVIDPTSPLVESPEEVRDRVLEAAHFLPLDRLGTTDDCGFGTFSANRSTAFAKIKSRVDGTELARRVFRSEFIR
jgi:5-methyltetrahydropteroyltriglutamate--homocysteine methyltransferase